MTEEEMVAAWLRDNQPEQLPLIDIEQKKVSARIRRRKRGKKGIRK